MANLGLLFDPAVHQVLSNLAVALDLARAGIPVFPCQPDGAQLKRPYPGVFWKSQSTTNEHRIEQWWERWPDAMPAIDLGKTDFIVLDLDGEGGLSDWHAITADHGAVSAPVVETPSGGRHLWFRRDGRMHGNGRGALPAKRDHQGIDVRGVGGYVIAPGATTLDGRRYEADGYDILSAQSVPDWLWGILGGASEREPQATPPAPAAAHVAAPAVAREDRRSLYGEAALRAECDRVTSCGKGGRNEALNRAAFALGTLVGGGVLGEADVRSALTNAAHACGLTQEDGVRACGATINSGLRAGMLKPRDVPESGEYTLDDGVGAESAAALLARRVVEDDKGRLYDAETGEAVDTGPAAPHDDPIGNDYAFGDISQPEGLLGEITDWIVATSRKPNRSLAMTAAIAIMAGICSRHLMGPTGSATHLYLVNLGATSVGKDRPFKAVGQLLKAAGYGSIVQSAKFKSDTAVELVMKSSRTSVAMVDEIGSAIFAKMGNRRATTHESAISSVLRELWSVLPGEDWQTSSRAGERSEHVASPALTIMGASTLNEFYRSLNGASVENGFLNRFTIIMADPPAEERDEALNRLTVPAHLSDRLASILPNAGNLQALNALLGSEHPAHIARVDWVNPEAEQMHLSLAKRIARWRDEDEVASPFLGRTAEMAVRLATIHAVGRAGRAATVTERDYRWGASVALASARFMIEDAALRMAETDFQANQRLVLSFLKKAGRMKRSEITRKVDGRWEPAITDRIMRGLTEGGQVAVIKGESTKEGGRKPDIYVYVKEPRQ